MREENCEQRPCVCLCEKNIAFVNGLNVFILLMWGLLLEICYFILLCYFSCFFFVKRTLQFLTASMFLFMWDFVNVFSYVFSDVRRTILYGAQAMWTLLLYRLKAKVMYKQPRFYANKYIYTCMCRQTLFAKNMFIGFLSSCFY